MKKVIIMITGVLASSVGYSQISIAPEIGANFSNIRTKIGENDATTNNAATGLRAGVGVNFDLYKGIYLRPGVYYSMLGEKSESTNVTATSTLHYLQIPVNVGYKYNISSKAGGVFAEAGPYIGYALAGKNKIDNNIDGETKTDIEFGDGAAEVNPLDWGFNFGLGYESPWGIFAKGSYGLGLGNLSNIDNYKATNRSWNVSLGYRIKL